MNLVQHEKPVWQVSVNNYTQVPLICSASADKTAKIVDISGKILKNIEGVHDKSIRTASWRPNAANPVLALGSFDSTISIFALESGNWEFLAQLEGPDNEIKRVSWSASGTYLATCSRDKTVWIWEIDEDGEDFECVAVLQEHSQDVKHVAWHPKEELLASCSYDNTIRLWRQDDDEWLCVSILEGHDSTVWGCDFDPEADSMRLVSCSDDLTVKIWSIVSRNGGYDNSGERLPSVARWDVASEEWEVEKVLPIAHEGTIYAVKWGPNGLIASAGADGRIVIYNRDTSDWKVHKVIENAHGVYEINSLDWSEDKLVSGGDDGSAKIWNVSS